MPQQASSLSVNKKWVIICILIIRSILACLFVIGINHVVQTGTSSPVLCLSALVGIVCATILSLSRLKPLGFVVSIIAAYLICHLTFIALSPLFSENKLSVFYLYVISLHFDAAYSVLAIFAITTWAFWRWRWASSLESLAIAALVIYALSGHREFHLESPQILNNAAWFLGKSPLKVLIMVGGLLIGLIVILLHVASWPARKGTKLESKPEKLLRGRRAPLLSSLVSLLAVLLLGGLSRWVFSYYDVAAATKSANGVGQATSEKMSPLGFHSALGGSNQPSALVRLEGDYSDNPFTPMLYLRETALSLFNGRELVTASRNFDRDISANRPDEPYEGQEDAELLSRTPLNQSVYLLTEHNFAFAVDYPVYIHQLKNPNPSRFKGAYRAYSVAPAFSLNDLTSQEVGDPRWTEEEKQLYSEQHSDPRYKALSEEITKGINSPIEKAFAITNYLSRHAIYTLRPGHEVGPNDDPVAPFLFGDMRGYCVHFAHATTYLLRAAGIPARIATGYLTDLSQAKDGHILLRMSDRHAWAEVFVKGKGWIPFDIKPDQVESHAETPVDTKLLEELMGLIGPDEEILPKDIAQDEKGMEVDKPWKLPDTRYLILAPSVIFILIVLVKTYLIYGWMLPTSPPKKLKRIYRAILCRLHDIGIKRDEGETRQAFRKRVSKKMGLDLLQLTDLLNEATYSPKPISTEQIKKVTFTSNVWKKVKRKQKFVAAFNISSVFSALFGGKW